MGLILGKKKVFDFLVCLRLKKKSVLKLSGRTVYIGRLGENRFMSSTGAPKFLKFVPKFLANLCTPYVNLHHTNRLFEEGKFSLLPICPIWLHVHNRN